MGFLPRQGLGSVLALPQPRLHPKLRTPFLHHQHRARLGCAHQHLSNIHCPTGRMLLPPFTQLSCRNVPLLTNFPGQQEPPRDPTAPAGTAPSASPGHTGRRGDTAASPGTGPLPAAPALSQERRGSREGCPLHPGVPVPRCPCVSVPGAPVSRCPCVPVPRCPRVPGRRARLPPGGVALFPAASAAPGILPGAVAGTMHQTRPAAPPSRLSPLVPPRQPKSRSPGLRWQPA